MCLFVSSYVALICLARASSSRWPESSNVSGYGQMDPALHRRRHALRRGLWRHGGTSVRPGWSRSPVRKSARCAGDQRRGLAELYCQYDCAIRDAAALDCLQSWCVSGGVHASSRDPYLRHHGISRPAPGGTVGPESSPQHPILNQTQPRAGPIEGCDSQSRQAAAASGIRSSP